MTPQAQSGSLFGISAIGSAIAGLGQVQAGKQQQGDYDYNADITLQNMRDQEAASQQAYGSRIGRQASGYAASGVDIASGSPLLIMAATAARGAQAGEQIREAGTEEANLQRYYGKVAAWSGTMGGIGTFLQGLTKAAMAYPRGTPRPTVGGGGGSIPGPFDPMPSAAGDS